MVKITKEQFDKTINYLKEFESSVRELNEKYGFSSNLSGFSDSIEDDDVSISIYHQWRWNNKISPKWHLDINYYGSHDDIHLKAETPEKLWEQYEKIREY